MLCIFGEYSVILATIKTLRQYPFTSWNIKTWLLVLLLSAIVPVITIIFGVAWWTIWKGKQTSRGWGIAASLTFVMISLYVFFIISRWVWVAPEVELAIGVLGLIAFLRRYEMKPKTNDSDQGNNLS
jgi:hypothetical protein